MKLEKCASGGRVCVCDRVRLRAPENNAHIIHHARAQPADNSGGLPHTMADDLLLLSLPRFCRGPRPPPPTLHELLPLEK